MRSAFGRLLQGVAADLPRIAGRHRPPADHQNCATLGRCSSECRCLRGSCCPAGFEFEGEAGGEASCPWLLGHTVSDLSVPVTQWEVSGLLIDVRFAISVPGNFRITPNIMYFCIYF